MAGSTDSLRIRETPLVKKVAILERYVRLCERAHARSSANMAAAVRDGAVIETGEISRWLGRYQILQHLRSLNGNGTGTNTKPI
jgi:hypothetical protein